ncbi:MAG: ATP-binding cassette domain-containing protein [bacterium]
MSPLRCENICCRRAPAHKVREAHIDSFTATFESGDITGFCGSDTAGKELLLAILGMIEQPDSGSLSVWDQVVPDANDPLHARIRDTSFGYLFTHPHLLPSFTVAENVAMPFLRICGQDDVREHTLAALEFAGIADLQGIQVSELPEAAHWRVAFARAIVHSPPLLVAISPPHASLLPLARRLADELGTAVLWNGDQSDALPFLDHFVEMNPALPQNRVP